MTCSFHSNKPVNAVCVRVRLVLRKLLRQLCTACCRNRYLQAFC